ncbi:uncharacterized protein LOC7456011 [Populus trichocarpa]|uniref:uncharacterized protein LOC7456011 n=1 Tax=Populus trichocarpa TaxID=3694 RepID=UPI000D188A09|nr:uncharacterized protein LOC7456011 [Populus trichocarpa]|eukprot:XP_024441575.1 uncharacterized protein LOC7456011 [Populus trichocarpa]
MASPLCFFKIFSLVLPLMFALAPVLILAGFLGYGLLSIFLTSTALILSSLILTFSKQKQTQVQKSVTDEIVMPDQSRECSDGSISDEDSLIEISLPGGHYICDHEEDEVIYNLQNKLPDFAPGSFFKQHGLMELLAELNEMNEEENLIEIDISMGSIKCPRFEIEA